jgi:hypothetical protein
MKRPVLLRFSGVGWKVDYVGRRKLGLKTQETGTCARFGGAPPPTGGDVSLVSPVGGALQNKQSIVRRFVRTSPRHFVAKARATGAGHGGRCWSVPLERSG